MKNLLYMALWFMGLVGGLMIWVVNASDTGCWEWLWTPPTTTYATWIEYGCDGDIPIITIYWDNWSWKSFWITIKAMNEWTWTVTIWSQNDTGAYWSLYQWWNNYPFPNVAGPVTLDNSDSIAVDARDYAPWTYSSDIWIKEGQWDSSDNRNLWWWSWDEKYLTWFWWYDIENFLVIDSTDRQAMCPDDYHIPSAWEWNALLYLWWKNYDVNQWTSLFASWILYYENYNYSLYWTWIRFSDDMQMPFVSGRYSNSKADLGYTYGAYWSSSPWSDAHYAQLSVIGPTLLNIGNDARAWGRAVRCFKNEYVKPNYSLIFDTQ